MISAAMSIPGARKAILKSIFIKFCIWVTSFVSLVTSEPVENLSILANEKVCTFSKTSCRRSAAKLTDAFAPKYEPPTPPAIIKTAHRIIPPITKRPLATVSVPSICESITVPKSLGMITSPATSTSIHSGVIRKYIQ